MEKRLPIIVTDPPGVVVSVSGGIYKFVDGLPGLNAGKANNLGQYILAAAPDTITYLGSDYYAIGVAQYREKMLSALCGQDKTSYQ